MTYARPLQATTSVVSILLWAMVASGCSLSPPSGTRDSGGIPSPIMDVGSAPPQGAFTFTGSMNEARVAHTATL